MTLVELVIATAVLTVVVGALAALSHGVQQSHEYGEAYGTVTQHARVVLDRISRTVNEATASLSFPGFMVLSDSDGSYSLPDTLVVWHPSGAPAYPNDLPTFAELVVYCFDAASPSQLLEITNPSNTQKIVLATFASDIAAMKQSSTAQKVKLTNLLRTASVSSKVRGAVRFASRVMPLDADWNAVLAGTKTVKELPWPQNLCGSQTGVRQVWVRMEIQLVPTSGVKLSNAAALEALPFFSSAAVYYPLSKPN